MDNPTHHDAQVKAFIEEAKRYAYVGDVENGEFMFDGVVNVRAALDAAMSAKVDIVKFGGKIVIVHPDMPAHYWDGERMHRVDMTVERDGSATTSKGGET